jgi:hypothetical protein
LKPKIIHIPQTTPIETWAAENKSEIMGAIYDNLFEFAESEEEDRVVLQVVSGPKVRGRIRKDYLALNADFILAKEDMSEIISNLLEHYVEVEEYEKCSELLKLKNKI